MLACGFARVCVCVFAACARAVIEHTYSTALLASPTCVGSAGESSRGGVSFVSSFRWHRCCCCPSDTTGSWPFCPLPAPPCRLTTFDPCCAPTSWSDHGADPVDRFGLGASHGAGAPSSSHLRPRLGLTRVLGGVRGERRKRGKGGGRGG